MNTEMDDIYRLALSNMATGLQDLEDRVAYLEARHEAPPHQTAFDLEKYRTLLERCIASCKRETKETKSATCYERGHFKIEAYEHALKLIELA
jgi:hypothetical protein